MARLSSTISGLRTSHKKPGSDDDVRRRFWHPSARRERSIFLRNIALAFVLIIFCLMPLLCLYFGAYFRQTENAYRLTVLVLDLDSAAATLSRSGSLAQGGNGYEAILGPTVTSEVMKYRERIRYTNASYWSLGYVFPSSKQLQDFSLPYNTSQGLIEWTPGVNATEWARQAVHNQDYFGAIVINGNATLNALNALRRGGDSYDSRGSMTFYYNEARNFYAQDQYVSPQTVELMMSAGNQAGLSLITNYLSGLNDGATLASADPNVLDRPFGFNQHNIEPFSDLGAEPGVTVGAIYLIILTFLLTPLWNGFFGPVQRKLTLGAHIFLKIVPLLLLYGWLSLHYSLLSLAFHVNMSRVYGRGGFPIYWALNFVTMTALGLVMEFFFTILGQAYFMFFLLFWVVLNVSVVFLDLADMDHFYSYGFVLPIWNNSDGTKHIFFATKNHLLQDFAVNFGWIAVFLILLVALVIRQRAKASKAAIQAAAAAERPGPKRHIRIFV